MSFLINNRETKTKQNNKPSLEEAGKVNKSKSAYERLEKGDVEMTLNEADTISKALGTDFNAITNSGMVFNNEKNTVMIQGQGNNPTINIKLDDEQFSQLLDKLK